MADRKRKGGGDVDSLSPLDRMIAKALGESVSLGCADDPLKGACPELWRWLTMTGDGTDHVFAPAKLTMTMTPGGVIVGISSVALACSLDASVRHAHEALEGLERALTGPAPAFRVWDGREAKVRKRRQQD